MIKIVCIQNGATTAKIYTTLKGKSNIKMQRLICNVKTIRHRTLFLLLGLCLSTNLSAVGEVHFDTENFVLFDKALMLCHQQDYEGALEIGRQLRQNYPDDPTGMFVQIITYQTLMETFRVKTYQAQLDSVLEIVVELAKKTLKKDRRNGVNYFYLASAYGARSANFARRGKWLEALRDGTRIKANYQRALKYSPDFYDAYYGLGAYNYWVSVKAKVLRIFGDSREKGIAQVKLAAEKGHFLKTNALYGLSSIYFNEGRHEEALQVCDEIIARYPGNPTCYYRKGRILQMRGQWAEAQKQFAAVRDILSKTPHQSLSYQVDCLYQMALCEYSQKHSPASHALCEQALALVEKCDFSRELNGPFEKYDEIQKRLQELYEKTKG